VLQEYKNKIEKYREKYNLFINDKALVLSAQEKQEILELIRTVNPGYTVQLYCGHCVGEMLKYAFKI